MKSAQWREFGPGAEGRERKQAISEASADAAPGTVVLAAGDALQDLRRAAAIDGVGIDAAILVSPLIWTPWYDRPAMVHAPDRPRRSAAPERPYSRARNSASAAIPRSFVLICRPIELLPRCRRARRHCQAWRQGRAALAAGVRLTGLENAPRRKPPPWYRPASPDQNRHQSERHHGRRAQERCSHRLPS